MYWHLLWLLPITVFFISLKELISWCREENLFTHLKQVWRFDKESLFDLVGDNIKKDYQSEKE